MERRGFCARTVRKPLRPYACGVKRYVKNVVSQSSEPVTDNGEYSIDLRFANLIPNLRILSTVGPIVADDEGVVEMTVSIQNNEEIIFYDLPVETTYQFTEQANDKKASYEIMDANGGTNIVTPTAENDVENKDLATSEETVNENEDATVTFINTGSMQYQTY